MQKKAKSGGKKFPFSKAIKGAVFGLVITVAAVLVLALIVKQGNMSDGAINAANQVIKVASVFLAAFIAARAAKAAHALVGALTGGLYVLMGYIIFSIVEGAMGDVLILLADLAMGIVVGMLTAVIFGRFLKRKTVKK